MCIVGAVDLGELTGCCPRPRLSGSCRRAMSSFRYSLAQLRFRLLRNSSSAVVKIIMP